MLYFEGVLCTYNFAAVTRVKNAFSRFATWFFDLPQGTIREIQEMYKWCRRSLLRDLWNSFSHDHFTLCFFTFFSFFIFHDRWSYFIFHIYRNEFWNISIKCSSFKERHFDYINLMRQYEKKWKKWNAVNLYAIWNHLNMNKFCIKINWTMIWHIANILDKFVKKNLFKLFMKYTLNCLYSMNFIDNIISNNF